MPTKARFQPKLDSDPSPSKSYPYSKEDGFDEPSHGSVVEADLSQLTGLKGLIENQELQMLEDPIGGVKVRLMGSLGTDHFEVSLG
ncbi:hypothetical protein Q3G72_031714 [Acer saccharum]|nr:hypothetical protein Q3G72_031714 [Acer saccharum]